MRCHLRLHGQVVRLLTVSAMVATTNVWAQVNTNVLRVWKATSGASIEARFVELQGNRLLLESADGGRHAIDVGRLSATDMDYVNREAPVPLASRLIGKWYGTASRAGHYFNAQFTIKKRGAKMVAEGHIFSALSEKQVQEGLTHRLKKTNVQPFARLLALTSTVSLDGDAITFDDAQAKVLLSGAEAGDSWIPGRFSGKATSPGLAVGVWECTAAGPRKDGVFCFYKEHALSRPLPLTLERGKVHALACLDEDRYHYSCYIPTNYNPSVPTPVLINADPGGNGKPLSARMGDEVGWIMVGLKESSNATSDISAENCVAAIFDLRRRFNIQFNRIYFSGFSGRAREAAWQAIGNPDACAGLICIGAGFSQWQSGTRRGQYRVPPASIPIFFLVGAHDMNFNEVTREVVPAETARKRTLKLVVHPGGHDWGRPEDHEMAIRWLNAQWKPSGRQIQR